MIDEDEYYEKRHELANFIKQIHPTQVGVELAIFDLLYNTKKERMSKENKAIKELYYRYKKSGFLDSEEQNFITDFKHLKKKYKHDTAYSIMLITGNLENYNYSKHYGKFKKNNACINEFIGDKKIFPNLELLAEQDGAIVLDNKGIIRSVNTYLVNIDFNTIPLSQLSLYDTTKERHDPKFYGFKQDVSTRHLSAIGASYVIPDVVTYTLGENMDKTIPNYPKLEHGQIRRYESGLITLSTLFPEEKTTKKNQEYIIEKSNSNKKT